MVSIQQKQGLQRQRIKVQVIHKVNYTPSSDKYTLLNGLTYNPAEILRVSNVFFRALKGRGKMRETSKMLGRIICQTIQWEFYYMTYLKKNFSFVFRRICMYEALQLIEINIFSYQQAFKVNWLLFASKCNVHRQTFREVSLYFNVPTTQLTRIYNLGYIYSNLCTRESFQVFYITQWKYWHTGKTTCMRTSPRTMLLFILSKSTCVIRCWLVHANSLDRITYAHAIPCPVTQAESE